ncbi:DUF475 domain-containing protein (plasmid) [Pseudomonas sp. Leaf58]|nr:DUF475 domain-containing protein [Pseudomonas sp. Leaf58]KQN62059.1 hypothetical protein ASF02_07710 [Pseudomonas sp. Leaf58]
MRHFWGTGLVTLICMIGAFMYGGPAAAFKVMILGVLEISVSFDNAVVNAKVLKDMSNFWRMMFLTVGILVAVFLVRLILPVGIVAVAADIGFMDTARMVFDNPEEYSKHLHDAHLAISAFGGVFLLMVFLGFLFNAEKEHHWLGALEAKFGSLGSIEGISTIVALALLMGVSTVLEGAQSATFLYSGALGLFVFFLLDMLKHCFENPEDGEAVADVAKKSGFISFMYLEVLDASFSLDGVIAAFAITKDPIVIMLGLAIGAMAVRCLTIYLVKKGTLDELVYLEAGAMYAIGILALIMLTSGFVHVPEVFTALAGALLIGAAIVSSLRWKKNNPKAAEEAVAA